MSNNASNKINENNENDIFQPSATSSIVNFVNDLKVESNNTQNVNETNIEKSINFQTFKKEYQYSPPIYIETQTEWSWISDIKLIETLKEEIGILETEKNDDEDNNDENKSQIDEQLNESRVISPEMQIIESIGPPKILKYQPESKKVEIRAPLPEERNESPNETISQYFKGFNIDLNGGSVCEFCGQITLPWPKIQQQENELPNTLYCCSDYREFVEAIVELETDKEKSDKMLINNNNYNNNINKKGKKKQSKKARQLAKERQEHRNLERQIARQKRNEELEKQNREITDTDKNPDPKLLADSSSLARDRVPSIVVDKMIMHQDSQRSHQLVPHSAKSINSTASLDSRQLKSINYQLSNVRFIQEGWTIPPDMSGFDDFDLLSSDDDDDVDVIVPAAISIQSIKMREKPLTYKYYKNGDVCMILFPDGSGNVFYPSGRLAISISVLSRGLHFLSVYSDDDETDVVQLATFDSYGNVCCNYLSGKIRLQMGPVGGIELENDGTKKKRWLWWDPNNHIHAPPYQPIIFGLNQNVFVKIFSQKKIYLNFYADSITCKFRVGSNLTIAKPESLSSSCKPDVNDVYLKKKKTKVDELLKLMRNNLIHAPQIMHLKNKNDFKLLKSRKNTNDKLKITPFESLSKSTFEIFNLTESKNSNSINDKKSIKTATTTKINSLLVP